MPRLVFEIVEQRVFVRGFGFARLGTRPSALGARACRGAEVESAVLARVEGPELPAAQARPPEHQNCRQNYNEPRGGENDQQSTRHFVNIIENLTRGKHVNRPWGKNLTKNV